MIKMIVKCCKCHDIPEDKCTFINVLRDLRLNRLANSLLEEREVPCTTT